MSKAGFQEASIRADALRYRYAGQDANAVAGVSSAFARGRFHALVGANGSGKGILV